jgi:hypothetical protein
MSDGPYRSLPMRPAWKAVARRADLPAYEASEIAEALVGALKKDCETDVRPEMVTDLKHVCDAFQGSLFAAHLATELARLRALAQTSLEAVMIESVRAAAINGAPTRSQFIEAVAEALEDRAMRGARQVEEHYLRHVEQAESSRVRDRVEGAIVDASPAIRCLAGQLLGFENEAFARPVRRESLEDGVVLE